jgi:excisionase family DNA binding protein
MTAKIEPIAEQSREGRRQRLVGQTSIKVESIAGYCMVSRSTVRRWIQEGRLSAMKLPSGHFRVTVKDFKTFLVRHDIPFPAELNDSQF